MLNLKLFYSAAIARRSSDGNSGGPSLVSSGCYLAQCFALGGDRLPPTIVDVVPIDEIDLVGQVAVAERLGQFGDFIERQPPAGIDRQIEIGMAPGAAGRPRAEHPCLGVLRQMRPKDIEHQPPVSRQQNRRVMVRSCEPAL